MQQTRALSPMPLSSGGVSLHVPPAAPAAGTGHCGALQSLSVSVGSSVSPNLPSIVRTSVVGMGVGMCSGIGLSRNLVRMWRAGLGHSDPSLSLSFSRTGTGTGIDADAPARVRLPGESQKRASNDLGRGEMDVLEVPVPQYGHADSLQHQHQQAHSAHAAHSVSVPGSDVEDELSDSPSPSVHNVHSSRGAATGAESASISASIPAAVLPESTASASASASALQYGPHSHSDNEAEFSMPGTATPQHELELKPESSQLLVVRRTDRLDAARTSTSSSQMDSSDWEPTSSGPFGHLSPLFSSRFGDTGGGERSSAKRHSHIGDTANAQFANPHADTRACSRHTSFMNSRPRSQSVMYANE